MTPKIYSQLTINKEYCGHRYRKVRGKSCLSKEEWLKVVFLPCFYCGKIDTRNSKEIKRNRRSALTEKEWQLYSIKINGIDRIDSSLGYIEGNCVPCCGMCNRMKWDYSKEEFLSQVKKICEKHELNKKN